MKWSYIAFFAVFELGSLLCGLAVSSPMFIIGRAVAGLGASGLVNGALSMIALAGPPEKRPLFMAMIMSIFSSGQILGPLIGGALTEHANWRWCFYINLPIGAITAFSLVFVSFPNEAGHRKKFTPATMVKDFDLIGFVLFVPSVIMLIMALQWGGTKYAWSSATIIGLFVGFGVLIIPLGWWEKRQGQNAMFPFPLLRQTPILSSCITGWLIMAVVIVLSYYLPLWFQSVKSASAFQSAIDTLPSFLSQIIFAILMGALCPKVVPYMTPFVIIGSAVSAIGAGLLSTLKPTSTAGLWIGYQIFAGAGRGMSISVPIQTVQQHVEKAQMATAVAMVSFFQTFGGAIFLSLAQTSFSNMLKHDLREYAPGVSPELVLESGATNIRKIVTGDELQGVLRAYTEAITKTFYIMVGASALALVTSFGMGWKRVEKKAKISVPAVQSEKERAAITKSADARADSIA